MTTDTTDHSLHRAAEQATPRDVAPSEARSRWLLPGIAAGLVATGLVIAGVISLTTLVYAGVFGGMIVMHLGHGGHGAHGAHGAQGTQGTHDRAIGSHTTGSDHDGSTDRTPSSNSCH